MDVDEALVIKYQTTVNDSAKKNNSSGIQFTNDVSLYYGPDGGQTKIEGEDTVSLKKGRVVYKSGSKSIGYNGEKYINWVIDVNTCQIDLGTALLSDSIGADMKLDYANGIEVYNLLIDTDANDGDITRGTLVDSSNYDIDYKVGDPANDDVTEFDITFDENITQAYRMVYRTIITDSSQSSF